MAALKKIIGKQVGHNKQISGEQRISFCKKFQNLFNNLFLLSKGCTSYVPQV